MRHHTPPKFRRLVGALILCGTLSSLHSTHASPSSGMQGETQTAPAVLLAENFADSIDPSVYLVSEKLDGVRALWDGKVLRFRSGRTIHAPAWFIDKLPAHALDGELWIGRGQFERVSAAVRRQQAQDEEWRMISYQVFEWPGADGTFSDRIRALRSSIEQARLPWLNLIAQNRVSDRQQLKAKLNQVVRDGGEGLMLHHADATWQTGRGDVLLKLKPHDDAEAKVIAHLPGKGKYAGMCGALLVETPDGKRFRLGSGLTDAQRRTPPPIGSMVTYRYRGFTSNGLPRFASFMRTRADE